MDRKTVFERNPKKTLISLSLLLFLIIDIGLTHLTKFYNVEWRKNVERIASETRIKHPVYHHTFKANSSEQIDHKLLRLSYNEKTNSLGFKDNEIREVSISSNDYRLIFIGDSITEGIGYTFDETFVGIISKELKADGIEVLNFVKKFRGLKLLINGHVESQDEIINFIEKCKENEDKNGFLLQDFFETEVNKITWYFSSDEAKDFDKKYFSMRMFFPSKMNQMLIEAGFTILHQWGDYYRTPLGEGSKLQIYDLCLP